ncbi:hypothetical protein [Altererythrobacter sp. Root672]|uniref:hypothetical protein n=1 Tax=Altererythrobacter sp. Root672 TaxID=1736584 RepID=UPI0006F5E030|nr:hypothetical protein [Altererythrobacter sp. Root672]KRA81247.1 hypothetical protein ASD76_11730 [Altererythrobacter sp. Root672]
MHDLDLSLRRLSEMPVPPGLDTIDDAVFAGLVRVRQDAVSGRRLMGIAAAFALVLGVAGGGLAGGTPAAAHPLSPFAADNALAPSTLLAVHP